MREIYGDLHIHTGVCFDIPKVTYCLKQALDKAAENGCGVVAITEHGVFHSYDKVQATATAAGVILIPAVEIRGYIDDAAQAGIIARLLDVKKPFVDILAYGVIEPIPEKQLPLSKVIEAIHRQNGLAVVAHPSFSYALNWYGNCGQRIIRNLQIDGIEAYNGRCLPAWNRAAAGLATKLNLPVTGGSDAHMLHRIGAGWTLFDSELTVEDWQGCLAAIKNRQTTAGGLGIKLGPFSFSRGGRT